MGPPLDLPKWQECKIYGEEQNEPTEAKKSYSCTYQWDVPYFARFTISAENQEAAERIAQKLLKDGTLGTILDGECEPDIESHGPEIARVDGPADEHSYTLPEYIAQGALESAHTYPLAPGWDKDPGPGQDEPPQLMAALAAMERAIDAVKAEAEKLPDFPQTRPKCCDNQTLRLIGRGYTRCTSIDFEDEDSPPTAYTNGWQDFTDEGDFQWIKCVECDKRWKAPEDLHYV